MVSGSAGVGPAGGRRVAQLFAAPVWGHMFVRALPQSSNAGVGDQIVHNASVDSPGAHALLRSLGTAPQAAEVVASGQRTFPQCAAACLRSVAAAWCSGRAAPSRRQGRRTPGGASSLAYARIIVALARPI